MEITCKLLEIKDNNIPYLEKGKYLLIKTSENNKPIYVGYNEFKNVYYRAK